MVYEYRRNAIVVYAADLTDRLDSARRHWSFSSQRMTVRLAMPLYSAYVRSWKRNSVGPKVAHDARYRSRRPAEMNGGADAALTEYTSYTLADGERP